MLENRSNQYRAVITFKARLSGGEYLATPYTNRIPRSQIKDYQLMERAGDIKILEIVYPKCERQKKKGDKSEL